MVINLLFSWKKKRMPDVCIQTKNKKYTGVQCPLWFSWILYSIQNIDFRVPLHHIVHCGQVEMLSEVSILGFYRRESEGHWDVLMGHCSHKTAGVIQGRVMVCTERDNNGSACSIKHIPSIDPSLVNVIPPLCVYLGLVGCRYFTATPRRLSLVHLMLLHIYLSLSKLTVPQALCRL